MISASMRKRRLTTPADDGYRIILAKLFYSSVQISLLHYCETYDNGIINKKNQIGQTNDIKTYKSRERIKIKNSTTTKNKMVLLNVTYYEEETRIFSYKVQFENMNCFHD